MSQVGRLQQQTVINCSLRRDDVIQHAADATQRQLKRDCENQSKSLRLSASARILDSAREQHLRRSLLYSSRRCRDRLLQTVARIITGI